MPKISLKSPEEILVMAEAGKILAQIVNKTLKSIKPGLSTLEIDSQIEESIILAKAKPSFKMVPGYHWASCVGLNSEVVHSVPQKDKIIKEGDILKIDAGVYWKGFHSDCSWTTIVPAFAKATEDKSASRQNVGDSERFLDAGKEALRKAIQMAKPGKRIGDISFEIQKVVEKYGYSPVRELTGHGIGRNLHEDPMIPCLLKKKLENTEKLVPGMVLAIEIIYNQGKADLLMEEDGWTIATKDGKISGLFEETVAVTENGPLILTEVRE